jgi:Ca2+-transporting ATPase
MSKPQTSPIVPDAPHALPVGDVLAALRVSVVSGLSEKEANGRLQLYGPNAIAGRQRAGAAAILLHQFQSLVVGLLAVAGGLAFYFGEWEQGAAIVGVLAVNAVIGFVTEIKARRSIEALKALGTRSARVCREDRTRLIPSERLVPGDVVLLDAGDVVSADMRLAEASNLYADEAALTGESAGVHKSVAAVEPTARVSDRISMLFKGTAITSGTGIGVVVATGMHTELGRISGLVEEAEPEASPLEKKLARLSGQLVWVTLILAALIGGIGVAQGKDLFLMAEAAIALAIAAVPEGLPIVATLTLARGMWRMARRNALIERLSAVETLGATTVILTDKTGTLTENRMTVMRVSLASGDLGVGRSGFEGADGTRERDRCRASQLTQFLEIAVLCSNATLGRVSGEETGDPMELALLRAARLAGLERSELIEQSPEVLEHAFDTATKMMATVHRRAGGYLYAVKGAPEAVLAGADRVRRDDGDAAMDEATRAGWLARAAGLGEDGLRVLAFAARTHATPDRRPFEELTFFGLVGLEDPPRADVPDAIRACHQAGIRVIMITGDHAGTARSIARAVELGGDALRVIEGRDLPDEPGAQHLEADIFARVSPGEKLALVRAFQAAGEIVAVTGDGVNDAPALRQADIGVAMGLRGTDVAREAAAMILLDDAFPTIVAAIREGRVIFGNIRRFAAYLLACNLSEILVVGLAVLFGLPLPLLPLQILFLNLVTDVFPAFALAMGEGPADILKRRPRNPQEPILGRPQWIAIVRDGIALTAVTFGALALGRFALGLDEQGTVTVTFLTLAGAQLCHVFNMRHPASRLVDNEITRNPWIWGALALCVAMLVAAAYVPSLSHVLQMVAPDPGMWGVVLGMSLALLPLVRVMKSLAR